MQENTNYNISSEISSKINKWLSKFPIDQKKPAIIYALHLIQHEAKYIRSEHINAVANFLGLRRETLSRVFSKFQKEQLIQVEGKKIQLLEVERLNKLADF